MLLAINVGNSRISVGIFDNCGNISAKFKVSTDIHKTSDEYCVLLRSIITQSEINVNEIDAAIVSSVVPQLSKTISDTVYKLCGIKSIFVGPGVKTGFPIRIDNPSELGGDIVANAAASLELLKNSSELSAVVVDMNTVTTVSAINAKGEFVGCYICPGIRMSFDSMHGNTAQLPNVSFSAPKHLIGKNSQDSVRSGVILGNAIMLDGFVYHIAKEMKRKADDLNLIITGEYAEYVIDTCNHKFTYDEDLTIKGLYCIYRNNIKQ